MQREEKKISVYIHLLCWTHTKSAKTATEYDARRKEERNKMMLDVLRLRTPECQLQRATNKLWIKYWNWWKKSAREKIKPMKNQNRDFLPGNFFVWISISRSRFYPTLFTYVRLVYIISSYLCSAHVCPSCYTLILFFFFFVATLTA